MRDQVITVRAEHVDVPIEAIASRVSNVILGVGAGGLVPPATFNLRIGGDRAALN